MPISLKLTPMRLRRLELEMKQVEAAERLGISQQRYSLIEREKVVPKKSEQEKLKSLFGEV